MIDIFHQSVQKFADHRGICTVRCHQESHFSHWTDNRNHIPFKTCSSRCDYRCFAFWSPGCSCMIIGPYPSFIAKEDFRLVFLGQFYDFGVFLLHPLFNRNWILLVSTIQGSLTGKTKLSVNDLVILHQKRSFESASLLVFSK